MAEKKSTKGKATPRKRTVKKVEEPKLVGDVQPAVEQPAKPREINWDVIGFTSAAITLAGAAIFYMVGWSYEVNWYGYFGVNMTQVSIPPQQVVIQSFSSIIGLAIGFGVASLYYFDRLNKFGKSFDLEEYFIYTASFSALIIIAALISTYVRGMRIVNIMPSLTGNPGNQGEILAFFLSVLVFVVYFWHSISSIVLNRQNMINPNQQDSKRNRITLLIVLFIVFAIGYSAYLGNYDAASGIRTSGGWVLQKVYISGNTNLVLPIELHQDFTSLPSNDIYGPFGLVAENEISYFLVRWKEANQKYFRRNPGIFILPRDGLVIIPANDPSTTIIVPSATPTVLLQPTLTMTNIPKPTKSLELTITPTIDQP